MKDYQLAWRNLWRNKRRTLITAASVFFAVFFALVMRSFQLGTYDKLFKDVIESYTGYLQLQNKDYFDEPMLDNSFIVDSALIGNMKNDPNVTDVVFRLESFALAAAGSRTQGVIVIGMDPQGEDKVLKIRSRLVKYKLTPAVIEAIQSDDVPEHTKKLLPVYRNEAYTSETRLIMDLDIGKSDTSRLLPVIRKHSFFPNGYINASDTNGILIGNGLSDYLKVNLGDTIDLIGMGYHGASAAGTFIVRGIVRMPSPDIDNLIVYLPINAARNLYDASGMATSAIVNLRSNDDKDIILTGERLKKITPGNLAIHTWQEMNALMVNQMEADNKSGMIMLAILYLVIAFGVFGTVLMMMAERKREFGMLVSIGMQKRKLAKVVSFEMLLIGFIGVVAGVIASLPLVFYGHFHPMKFTGEMGQMYEDYGFDPVMPTMLPDTFYLWQVIIVLIILLIAISFSIRRIFKINVINALRA